MSPLNFGRILTGREVSSPHSGSGHSLTHSGLPEPSPWLFSRLKALGPALRKGDPRLQGVSSPEGAQHPCLCMGVRA